MICKKAITVHSINSEADIFKRVWDWFITLDQPLCLGFYRSDGKKCATGLFIRDEDYHPKMEHHSIKNLIHLFPQISYLIPYTYILIRLQEINDQNMSKLNLKRALICLAEEFDIQLPK